MRHLRARKPARHATPGYSNPRQLPRLMGVTSWRGLLATPLLSRRERLSRALLLFLVGVVSGAFRGDREDDSC